MVTLRSSNKPPLPARSPIMLRSRRKPLHPISDAPNNSSLGKSTQSPGHKGLGKSGVVRPEYHSISCELVALAKMVRQEFGAKDEDVLGDVDLGAKQQKVGPLFERGRLYEEYAARRNERLERKRRQSSEGCYNLGVRVDSCKKKEVSRLGSALRVKAVSSTPRREVDQACPPSSSLRYSLRSHSKDGKISKPSMIPLPPATMVNGEKSVGARRIKKI